MSDMRRLPRANQDAIPLNVPVIALAVGCAARTLSSTSLGALLSGGSRLEVVTSSSRC